MNFDLVMATKVQQLPRKHVNFGSKPVLLKEVVYILLYCQVHFLAMMPCVCGCVCACYDYRRQPFSESASTGCTYSSFLLPVTQARLCWVFTIPLPSWSKPLSDLISKESQTRLEVASKLTKTFEGIADK